MCGMDHGREAALSWRGSRDTATLPATNSHTQVCARWRVHVRGVGVHPPQHPRRFAARACVRPPHRCGGPWAAPLWPRSLTHKSAACGLRSAPAYACVGCVCASGRSGQPWSSCLATSQPPSPPGQESLPQRTHLAVFAAVFAARERACDGRRLCALIITAHTRTRHRAPPLALARACRQNLRLEREPEPILLRQSR